jgi:hypothetical protein
MLLARCLLLALGTLPVFAQTGPLMSAIQPRYNTAKLNLIESAQAMPAESYSYRLTPEQRSFGEWIEHNVGMNYNLCSQGLGQPAPRTVTLSPTDKDALVKAITASFQYCDALFLNTTDEKALAPLDVDGRKVYPVNVMIGLLASWNAHYGNIVGYLRTKGIVPPSTARARKK